MRLQLTLTTSPHLTSLQGTVTSCPPRKTSIGRLLSCKCNKNTMRKIPVPSFLRAFETALLGTGGGGLCQRGMLQQRSSQCPYLLMLN